jgi:hypothetical protein
VQTLAKYHTVNKCDQAKHEWEQQRPHKAIDKANIDGHMGAVSVSSDHEPAALSEWSQLPSDPN